MLHFPSPEPGVTRLFLWPVGEWTQVWFCNSPFYLSSAKKNVKTKEVNLRFCFSWFEGKCEASSQSTSQQSVPGWISWWNSGQRQTWVSPGLLHRVPLVKGSVLLWKSFVWKGSEEAKGRSRFWRLSLSIRFLREPSRAAVPSTCGFLKLLCWWCKEAALGRDCFSWLPEISMSSKSL